MSGENDNGQGNTGAGDGDNTPSFTESLGESHQSNALFEGVEDVTGLADKFVEAHSSIEELTKQNAELQRETPADAAAYDLGLPEGISEADMKNFDGFKELAHELKLTSEEAQKLVAFDLKLRDEAVASFEANVAASKEVLVKEFGDKYDAELDNVKAVLKQFGGEEMLADIDIADPEAGLLNHPGFFRLLSKVAAVLGPDTLVGRGKGNNTGGEKQFHQLLYPESK